ncbi:SRPBCC family protein [Streptomyces sp. NBC_00038]|uniref:SRPBCC family protein n=1 Tax=Streptomyces sp. NBC_00038 TaxID=2903615 RepID=UPI00224D60DB|nr:SRPBCC family protein [Streptomyces sp. NBC_00038]MCX5555690.1 SRPBCC family protein [Streptomyces sp. NBC_00038]
MDFTNEFRVNLPADQAWALLTDVERIAPCMPGAQLTGVDGDAYNGLVKVKVGPMTVQYKGVVSFVEKDGEGRTAVLHARGRDTRGQGNADARVTARLTPDGDGTRVAVDTRLTITGKIAQFGKGMIEEVSGKLLTQFVDNLEGQLAAEKREGQEPLPEAEPESEPESGSGASAETAPAAPASDGVRPSEAPSVPRPSATAAPEPLDLMSVARGALLKRALPAVIVIAVIVIVLVVWLTAG